MKNLINNIKCLINPAWKYRRYAMITAWLIAIASCLAIFAMPDRYEPNTYLFADTEAVQHPQLKQNNFENEVNEPENGRDAITVAETLLNIFVKPVRGDSQAVYDTAQRFLKQQIREYKSRLIESDKRLTDFKRKNIIYFPTNQVADDIARRLQVVRNALGDIDLQLKVATIRRDGFKAAYRESEVALTEIHIRAKEYKRRIEALNVKLDTSRHAEADKLDIPPKVEDEMKRLTQDYNINKETYEQLVQRLESARMYEQMSR